MTVLDFPIGTKLIMRNLPFNPKVPRSVLRMPPRVGLVVGRRGDELLVSLWMASVTGFFNPKSHDYGPRWNRKPRRVALEHVDRVATARECHLGRPVGDEPMVHSAP